jgi:hypothetical protein
VNRRQYVSQKAVKDDDVYRLSDSDQDRLIQEVNESMVRDMRERTKDAQPEGGTFSLWVTGPHQDPLQGTIHVHHIAAWYDLDKMQADAQFRLDALAAGTAEAAPLSGGEAVQ